MSKKSKKRSRKRSYSSPSREDDDEKKRKKSKENEERHKDKYEDKKKRESSYSRETKHSTVRGEDFSRGRAIKKAVYRQSRTSSIESVRKDEGRWKRQKESQSCHAASSSREKTANVGKTTIISESKSKDQRPSTSTNAFAVPLKKVHHSLDLKFLEKSHKRPEKLHTSALPLPPAREDGKRVAVEKTHKDSPHTKPLSFSIKARDSLSAHFVVAESKERTSTTSLLKKVSSEPGNKERHKAAKSSHQQEKAFTLSSPQKILPSFIKSSKDLTSSRSAVTSRSSGTAAPMRAKISDSKEAIKKVLCAEDKSPSKKIPPQSVSVNSAHVSTNFTVNNWTSVTAAANIVKDFPKQRQKERENVSYTQEKVHRSPEEKLSPKSRNNAASTSTSKPWMVSSVTAAPKSNDKQSHAHPPSLSCETNSQALLDEPSTSCDPNSVMWCDQMQVAEELHLARSEKRLEVNVWESYGELTCMDIDSPEEGATETHSKQQPQQDLILVLDTNILLSHLDYVKHIISHGLEVLGHPIVLIPWVVLQELDSLKKGRGLAGSVSHLACPAISYIHNSLKNREPYLWGQSMQQAAEINDGLNAENNDDRVLQCCLQYQTLYPGCALILCTNDKNLCSKALLSGVKAFSKTDLEAENRIARRPNTHSPLLPVASSTSATTTPRCAQSKSPAVDINRPEDVATKIKIKCISELELCLKDVLADVLEKEMKAVYDELWLEIVFRKPPWTLSDVLQCLKKHWIAVFGSLVSRNLQDNVKDLMQFFNSGKSSPACTVIASIYQAKELVKAFKSRSSLVSNALSQMDNMVKTLKRGAAQSVQPPTEDQTPDCDVIMNDVEDYREPAPPQVSYQEVWAMFENIWANVCQISLEVFKALSFDPDSMQSGLPVGGPPPPQDALACLSKLSSMISQLLEAFSRVLSSAPGEDEVQNLLLVIRSTGISEEVSRLSEKVLMDCFSNQEYREKLRVGGTKLLKLNETLEACHVSTALVPSHGAFSL